jgi:FdhD protein
MAEHASISAAPAEEWRVGRDRIATVERAVPDEVPVGIAYDGRPHVVLMATPADAEDLGVGFTVSEGIAGLADIEEVRVEPRTEGITVDIRLSPPARKARAGWRKRSMEGRSSCGLCGVERLDRALRGLKALPDGLVVRRPAIGRALSALAAAQALGRLTRAMHAAAWCGADGTVLAMREDVGRHNALDKVVGAAALAKLGPEGAFLLITSRASYEMVEKAATAGIAMLVAISAPTALAIRKAEEAGLTLVALARDDGHAVFTRPDRILDEAHAATGI